MAADMSNTAAAYVHGQGEVALGLMLVQGKQTETTGSSRLLCF
jgi:hypothetical protein